MADSESQLESVQPPKELLAQLKPSPDMLVSDFLQLPAPRRPDSRKTCLDPMAWFANCSPTAEMATVESLLLPATALCSTLDSSLAKVIESQLSSVQHPVKDGVYLPLWTVRAWKSGSLLSERQKFWRSCLDWVLKKSYEEHWDDQTYQNIKAAILMYVLSPVFILLESGCCR
jgi:hypothetical protein